MTLKATIAMPDPSPRSLRHGLTSKLTAMPELMLSDYWFLAGLILALLYMADPFMLRLDKIGPTKHLPLMISLEGVLLASIGYRLFQSRERKPMHHWQILLAGLPLILLGIWIVLGSLYARKYGGINNTFMTVGLYMLFTFLAARMILISPARARIVRAYLLAASGFSAFMVLRMAASIGDTAISYHELEALIIPLAVYFALRPVEPGLLGSRFMGACMTLFFLAAGLVFRKNTGFMVLALTMAYLWIAEWRFRFRESMSFRFFSLLWVVLVLIAGIATTAYLAQQRGEFMPSGNPQYRLKTYEVAIDRFMNSPGWGTGFTAPATEKFTAYHINSAHGILATHSDVLDLAAQGGIIALSLWLWGYLRIGAISLRHALNGRPRTDMRAAAHALACMSLTSIVVYAFNPILLQPGKAFLMWSQLGMLLGLALHFSNHPEHATTGSKTAAMAVPALIEMEP